MTLPAEDWPAATGVQLPRISNVPEYVSTSGDEAIELCEMAGLYLDPWQQYCLRNALGEREDQNWAAICHHLTFT